MIFLFLLASIIFSQDTITTKSYSLYISNKTDQIDLSELIPNMKGTYELNLVDVNDIEWNNNNKRYRSYKKDISSKNNYCELQFGFNNEYNNDYIVYEECNNNKSIIGKILFDDINSYILISKDSYSYLSFSMIIWIRGHFPDNAINTTSKESDNGILREYHDNGNLYIEYNYKDGKRHGEQKRWYENGKVEIIYYYNMGKLEGKQSKWHKNGTIKSELIYKNDKLNGISKEWLSSGKLKSKKLYIDGSLEKILE